MNFDAGSDNTDVSDPTGTQPLTRVRYGLGKELQLFSDAIAVVLTEQQQETRYDLDAIRRMILMPGEHTPSKLLLMFEMDDGTTVIAADGMSNVKGFRTFLATLETLRPDIELDPPNMDDQLSQALEIRKRYTLGCYGAIFGSCLIVWVIYLIVAVIGAHAGH